MPTKRPHKKSRHGCDRCRKRRVKCDEKLPRCSICIQRQEECCYPRRPSIPAPDSVRHSDLVISSTSYSRGDVPALNTITATKLKVPRRTDGTAFYGSAERTDRFRELELMHHWCASTCNSFTEEIGETLRDHTVQEALRHEYLMEAVLALTSLHIASSIEDVEAADNHVSAALDYQRQAVTGLRSTLDAISPKNCDAVFISSMIIMVCTIVSPLFQNECNQQTQSTAESMLKLIDFLNGIQSVLVVSRDWLSEGPLSCILNSRVRSITMSLCAPLEEIRHLNNIQNSHPMRLVFDHAISTLEQTACKGRSVIPWIAALKPEFLKALRDGDGFALTIFMQWGVLLDQFDGMWWAKLSGRRLVDEISATLDARSASAVMSEQY